MTRKKKTEEPIDEEQNRKALDDAAGVAKSAELPDPKNFSRPANGMPLLKTDTREKLLYKIACTGTPLGAEFFDNFTDMKEVLELALSISVRLCVVAICNSELAPTQRIACMRLVAALNGKQLPPTDEESSPRPAPPFSIPTGSKEDVTRTLEAIKRVSI